MRKFSLSYFLAWIFFRVLFFFFYRIEIQGKENIPRGPHVVCPTHRSHLDTIAVGLAYPMTHSICYMAKEELFAVPLLGRIIRSWGAFPVRRGSRDQAPVETAVALLKKGEVVGIYPEGTRKSGKEVGSLKTGAVRVALLAKVPLLPVSISGTEEAFPKGAKIPRPGKIKVKIGKPLDLSFYYEKPCTRDLIRELSEKLRTAMNALRA